MSARGAGTAWKRVAFAALLVLVLGFSLHALARPAQSGGRPEHGSCCSRLIEPYCPPCLGVWICAEPEQRSSCSCVCGAVAEEYGCPWVVVWCE